VARSTVYEREPKAAHGCATWKRFCDELGREHCERNDHVLDPRGIPSVLKTVKASCARRVRLRHDANACVDRREDERIGGGSASIVEE